MYSPGLETLTLGGLLGGRHACDDSLYCHRAAREGSAVSPDRRYRRAEARISGCNGTEVCKLRVSNRRYITGTFVTKAQAIPSRLKERGLSRSGEPPCSSVRRAWRARSALTSINNYIYTVFRQKSKYFRTCEASRSRAYAEQLTHGSRAPDVSQSPSPGLGEKYFSNLPATPSNSLASAGGSLLAGDVGPALGIVGVELQPLARGPARCRA